MSSKGQVGFPEEIRKRLRLKPGARFVVVGEGDVVVLKSVQSPSMREFGRLIGEARRQARAAGLKRSDVRKAVAAMRGKKRGLS